MTNANSNLKETLRGLVLQFGFEQVGRSLREIRNSELHVKSPKSRETPARSAGLTRPARKKPKVSAPEYVEKMKLDKDKEEVTIELATKFERKDFLPTFGDIDNFCQVYGIDTPVSKSRASSIPRVFKYIASMEPGEIRRIIEEGMFSGPSRLGPIADAIRRNGRARRTR